MQETPNAIVDLKRERMNNIYKYISLVSDAFSRRLRS